jgi:hypothetical protein
MYLEKWLNIRSFAPILCVALGLGAHASLGHADQTETAEFTSPSGHVFGFVEALQEPADMPRGQVYRFRFVAPQIARDAGGQSFDDVSADMQWLCQDYALLRLADAATPPTHIVISLSERPVPFGTSAPDVTQFFEAYTIEDGRCIWEMF